MTDNNNSALEKSVVSADSQRILPGISSPDDVRKLDVGQLPQLAKEVREKIVSTLSDNPGHFASSMGAVEIAIALHYVLDTPTDKIVWDVGHQAYAHKILTGRCDRFDTLRTKNGLSGFPNPKESEYDAFIAGHASNSISAALGMAIANLNTPGHEKNRTVAVIGDASISGGLAFEGLNNASNAKNNLLIILNDNDMSIDDNVGALHRYLSMLTTSERYNKIRNNIYQFFRRKGFITEEGRGRVLRFNNSLKALVSGGQNIFEGLNIRYFGPFNGHDVEGLVKVLNEIKDMEGPRILHLHTVKGKGFESAEKNPAAWHAPGKFDPNTGERKTGKGSSDKVKWQDIFGNTLVELAEADERVCGITAAMLSGTSVNKLQEHFPLRTFDVGISEGHAVTFAGGLAISGKRPFVAIYSSFLQRAYDNVIHDIGIQGLPVTFCIDRAGLVGEDGVTHHGMFDLSYLRVVPGLNVASPMNPATLRNLMRSSLDYSVPIAIRYPRGASDEKDWKTPFSPIEIGKGREITCGPEGSPAVLSIGPIGKDVIKAVEKASGKGVKAAHYDMIWVKPLDAELLARITEKHTTIITVEDGAIAGGFGSAVGEWISDNCKSNRLIRLGAPDKWIDHGSVAELRKECGYDTESIADTIIKAASEDNSKRTEKGYGK